MKLAHDYVMLLNLGSEIMNYVKSIFFVVLFNSFVFAQAPDSMWTRGFGGSLSDQGNSVQQTSDGGYVIVGTTQSFGAGASDVWLLKTDANGDTLWTRTFGGDSTDIGNFVLQTSDQGFIITGHTRSFGNGKSDIWLIRTDNNGDTLWTTTFGGISDDEGAHVQFTSDGGYIITGHTKSFGAGGLDVWLINTNANGDTLWSRTFGGNDDDWGRSVYQTIDGGYVITGTTWSYPIESDFCDLWLIKTDSYGDTIWTKTIGGYWRNFGSFGQPSYDGGFILAGYTEEANTGVLGHWFVNSLLIKADSLGNAVWTKSYRVRGYQPLKSLYHGGPTSVQQTSDEGYIVSIADGLLGMLLLAILKGTSF
jgi:hypothetical protein